MRRITVIVYFFYQVQTQFVVNVGHVGSSGGPYWIWMAMFEKPLLWECSNYTTWLQLKLLVPIWWMLSTIWYETLMLRWYWTDSYGQIYMHVQLAQEYEWNHNFEVKASESTFLNRKGKWLDSPYTISHLPFPLLQIIHFHYNLL